MIRAHVAPQTLSFDEAFMDLSGTQSPHRASPSETLSPLDLELELTLTGSA